MRAWLSDGPLRRRLRLCMIAAPLVLGCVGIVGRFVLIRAATTRAESVHCGIFSESRPETTSTLPGISLRSKRYNQRDLRGLLAIAPSIVSMLVLLFTNLGLVRLSARGSPRGKGCAADVRFGSVEATPSTSTHTPTPTPTPTLERLVEKPDVVDRLQKQLAALRESNGQFAQDASNVLRTSVAAVCLQVANLRHGSGDQREERLKELEDGARRLAAAASEVLELANARLEPPRTLIAEIPLRRIVYNAVAHSLPLAIERDVDLGAEDIDDIYVVMAEDDVQRLLVHVIDNAVRQSEPGSRVDVTVALSSGFGVVDVTRHGPHSSEAKPGSEFSPLSRAERYRDDDSMGLGLSIAVALAERYGGRVLICRQSKERCGTTMRLELPLSLQKDGG